MSNITIEFRGGASMAFMDGKKGGVIYEHDVAYSGSFAVVTDGAGRSYAFPSDLINQIKAVPSHVRRKGDGT